MRRIKASVGDQIRFSVARETQNNILSLVFPEQNKIPVEIICIVLILSVCILDYVVF